MISISFDWHLINNVCVSLLHIIMRLQIRMVPWIGARFPPMHRVLSQNHFFPTGAVGMFAPWHSVQFCCAVIPTFDTAFHVDLGWYVPSFQALRFRTRL